MSIVGLLDDRVALLPFWGIVVIYISVLLVIAVVALWRKWLTPSGTLGAFSMGFIVLYMGGFSAFSLFFFFFFTCSILSKIKKSCNRREKKGSRRDLMQVIANGLPAVLALFLSRSPHFYRIAVAGYSAALAEAMADTFASTFGIMSKNDPVSVITFTKVPRGISGGVTVRGLVFSLLGSSLMALLHYAVLNSNIHQALIIAGTGFLGSLIDSVLGATVQEHFETEGGSLTEKEYDERGKKNRRVRGIPGFDNDIVNLVSGILSLSASLFLLSLIS